MALRHSATPTGGKGLNAYMGAACVVAKFLLEDGHCVAFGCKNYVGKKEGLRFFRFPLNDQERCSKWTAAVKRAHWRPPGSVMSIS